LSTCISYFLTRGNPKDPYYGWLSFLREKKHVINSVNSAFKQKVEQDVDRRWEIPLITFTGLGSISLVRSEINSSHSAFRNFDELWCFFVFVFTVILIFTIVI